MDDRPPQVSIVVPVFNGERYLRESLDSIVVQTYPHVDVLVMDDASTDGTPAIIASYGDRIRQHRQPRNRGQFDNINDGIARARGELIAVFHADDVYHPRIVEREVRFLQRHPSAGAVFCQDLFIDAGGREFGRLTLPAELRGGGPFDFVTVLNALLTYRNRFLVCPGAMVRASVYRDVGAYRGAEYGIAADLDMWVRIARCYPLGILEDYLLSYRSGHENLSRQYFHLRTEPEGHFRIMDECLSEGGLTLATPASLAAHRAHRAEDALMRAITLYILDQRRAAITILHGVRSADIIASGQVQRSRLLLLLALLRVLVRLPRIGMLADLFYRRWHGRGTSLHAATDAMSTP